MTLLLSLLFFRHSKISSSMTLVNGLVLIAEDKIDMVRGDKVSDDARLGYCRKIKGW
jgi:hypothetical protein